MLRAREPGLEDLDGVLREFGPMDSSWKQALVLLARDEIVHVVRHNPAQRPRFVPFDVVVVRIRGVRLSKPLCRRMRDRGEGFCR